MKPTLQHRELYSRLCGDLNGKEIPPREDIRIHVADSLCQQNSLNWGFWNGHYCETLEGSNEEGQADGHSMVYDVEDLTAKLHVSWKSHVAVMVVFNKLESTGTENPVACGIRTLCSGLRVLFPDRPWQEPGWVTAPRNWHANSNSGNETIQDSLNISGALDGHPLD